MVIWVTGRNYPLPENNMQGSFELEQAKMLARFGNEVHYLACSLHPTKSIGGRGLRSWEEDGVTITVLSAFFAPRIRHLYFVGARNKKWAELFSAVEEKSGLPDVIHVHYPSMLMIADTLKKYHDRGIRTVATEHWTKVLAKKLDQTELSEYRKYKGVLDRLICVGAPLKNTVKELTGIEGIVIPNIVNALFCPSEKEHEGFRFAAVGRLVKVKQSDRIIEAFSDCFAGDGSVTLTIIGGGEEKENLKRIIDERRAGAQVKLAGSLDRETTARTVSECDCLICFSRLETFGVPIIEAWACGIPAIGTTAAAVTDRFDERLGLEIPFDDMQALKNAMTHVHEHKNDYDRNYISNYAAEHYSEDVIYHKLSEAYGK